MQLTQWSTSPEDSLNHPEFSTLSDPVWSQDEWERLHQLQAHLILEASDEEKATRIASHWGRKVLRRYSSSFFAVTRFLPAGKRDDVEMVYAAVRYPDEVVDSFPLDAEEKSDLLAQWRNWFTASADHTDIRNTTQQGIPVTIAGYRDVARRSGIPDRFYNSFLDAMEADIAPPRYSSWEQLIDNYIYGSATVVGYFLAHIYGSAEGANRDETLESAKALAIALQLTNFARDVTDDSLRGRCYLPTSCMDRDGNSIALGVLNRDPHSMLTARHLLASEADRWYEMAQSGIDSFHPDSRVAIDSCHRLYSRLNSKILLSEDITERLSLTLLEKFSVLPSRKYWRLPMALVLER